MTRRESIALVGAALAIAAAFAAPRLPLPQLDPRFGPPEIPGDGLAVALIQESGDAQLQALAQSAAFTAAVRAAGGEYRLLDATQRPELDDPRWLAAWELPRDGLPWLVISHQAKRRGYRGPPPTNEAGQVDVDAIVDLIAEIGS